MKDTPVRERDDGSLVGYVVEVLVGGELEEEVAEVDCGGEEVSGLEGERQAR